MKIQKLIDEEMAAKVKYKDVGTCMRTIGKQSIHRSKFKKPLDAQKYLDMLKRLKVIDPTYEVYKCPECHLWHVGLKEWSNK